ncbi:hypothetical protein ACFQVC_32700 [Streptomyces monticola]|uniref:Flp pilus-assembly TadG-like N-terminal domain-containing protein n=1 Tax=Streptomyces monticola TaxID=2666263 RepID=A0ABW2JTH9_9ACTN
MISVLRARYRRSRFDDTGGISVFVAIVTAPLLLAGLLIVDAFALLRTQERADALALEAARAAGQAVDPGQAVPGEAFVADPQAAAAAAAVYLAKAGVSGTTRLSDGGTSLTVTVTDSYQGKFTPTHWTVQGESSATLLHGITKPEDN